MWGIPAVNLVAAAHLLFIGIFFGVYASETVVEIRSYFRKQDREALDLAARSHYLIDTYVEIPVLLLIVATGLWLALLVPELTFWHWVLMGLALCTLPGALNCIFAVRKRRRLLSENAPDKALRAQSRRIVVGTALFINPFLTGIIIIGSWLAYHRVHTSIYG